MGAGKVLLYFNDLQDKFENSNSARHQAWVPTHRPCCLSHIETNVGDILRGIDIDGMSATCWMFIDASPTNHGGWRKINRRSAREVRHSVGHIKYVLASCPPHCDRDTIDYHLTQTNTFPPSFLRSLLVNVTRYVPLISIHLLPTKMSQVRLEYRKGYLQLRPSGISFWGLNAG